MLSELGQLDAYEVIVEDVTKQRELEDHLRRMAASDPLTGLANYRHLIDALDMEIRRSNRTGREFALLLFDMDGLKQLNDSYGHLTGSQALCRTADALTLFCRDIDTAARFGGDEFALLLPETGTEAAHSVARRVGCSITEDSNGPPISVSVGVSVSARRRDGRVAGFRRGCRDVRDEKTAKAACFSGEIRLRFRCARALLPLDYTGIHHLSGS